MEMNSQLSIHRSLFCVLTTLLLLSCVRERDTPAETADSFIQEIQSSLTEAREVSITHLDSPSVIRPLRFTAVPDSEYLISVDMADWTIVLLNRTGEELDRIGGSGRGPGEFGRMGRLHIGHDRRLYLLDSMLRRMTVFEIVQGELQYADTIPYDDTEHLNLRSIYVTEIGNFGVFHRMDDYETWDHSYHLYQLDARYQIESHLLEMPGDENVQIADYYYIHHPLGKKTFWDLDGEQFYYVSSDHSDVHTLNLITGEEEVKTYFHFDDRLNSPDMTADIKEWLDLLVNQYPAIGRAIEESHTIPLFSDFAVRDGLLVFQVYSAGGPEGHLLLADTQTGRAGYITVSPLFFRLSPVDETIYGIDSEDSEYRQVIVSYSLHP